MDELTLSSSLEANTTVSIAHYRIVLRNLGLGCNNSFKTSCESIIGLCRVVFQVASLDTLVRSSRVFSGRRVLGFPGLLGNGRRPSVGLGWGIQELKHTGPANLITNSC